MPTAGNSFKRKKFNIFDMMNVGLMLILAMIIIFPFYYVLIISFAKYSDLSQRAVYLFPSSLDFGSYKFLLTANNIVHSFFISVLTAVTGTIFSMVLTTAAGYALSKKEMPGRNALLRFVIFTMFFQSGLIPYFLTLKRVGLVNNLLVLILPVAVNGFYLIIMKNFLSTIPPALEESAKMDGANDIYILYKIVIPTAAPVMATISLFYAVDRWNEWWLAMLFLSKPKLYPLQLTLREILFNFEQMMRVSIGQSIARAKMPVYTRSVQMAVVVITTIPIALVYPFLQKYYSNGIMIGSVKE